MDTILEYISWRGDLTLKQSEFNVVDALILAGLSYLPFDNIISNNYHEATTIETAYKIFSQTDDIDAKLIMKEHKTLLHSLSESNRFKHMNLCGYVNNINFEEEKQFSAITINTNDGACFISYRGTDTTLVGWKEDFNMSYMEKVPAQIEAKNYLEEVSSELNLSIRIAGHSKGGNLALYASCFCNKAIQNSILNVYNFDGPGLNYSLELDEDCKSMFKKIHTYLPQSSIVGVLLKHVGDYSVIFSYNKGILQHDLFSWEIVRTDFLYVDSISAKSIFIDNTTKEWLSKVDGNHRQQFFDALYKSLKETNNVRVDIDKIGWLRPTKAIIEAIESMDVETKNMILKTLKELAKSAENNFRSPLKTTNG